MRDFTEIGRLSNVSDDVNEAYRAYASAYLDWVDDNMSHFLWRDIDIRPIKELEEAGVELTNENIKSAYINAAKEILESSSVSKKEIAKEYPLITKYVS